jgi:hypothetical protein
VRRCPTQDPANAPSTKTRSALPRSGHGSHSVVGGRFSLLAAIHRMDRFGRTLRHRGRTGGAIATRSLTLGALNGNGTRSASTVIG